MGVTFEKISVLVFSIEQTSQEDLFRTNRGAYPPVPFEQPREVMTQVSSGPAFAGPHQALAAIESAIGYLAAADATAMAADLDRAVAAEQAPEPASTRSREALQLAIIEAVVPSRGRRASVGSSRPPGPGISPAGHPPRHPIRSHVRDSRESTRNIRPMRRKRTPTGYWMFRAGHYFRVVRRLPAPRCAPAPRAPMAQPRSSTATAPRQEPGKPRGYHRIP
jgi:hypothetical protein